MIGANLKEPVTMNMYLRSGKGEGRSLINVHDYSGVGKFRGL